jgi:hypothetical protein
MEIPFTQFLRPHGRPIEVRIDRPDEVAIAAEEIRAAGFAFECEELSTGEVSLTIRDLKDGGDADIEVCANGPDVPAAVDRLITRFAAGA